MEHNVSPDIKPKKQTIDVAETVGPQVALTHRQVLNYPETQRMRPSFFIYENNKAKEQYIFKPKKDTAL